MIKNKETKPYRESRVVVKALKKPILGGKYTGTRAKVDSLGEVIDTCVKCKKNPTNDISNWCEMCVRNIIL